MRNIALIGAAFFPQSQSLHYYAGLAHFMLKNYRGAIPFFNTAVKLDDRDLEAYYYRGLCYDKLGKGIAKLADFSKVAHLKGEESQRAKKWVDTNRLHLNTELLILRYQVK